MSTLPEDRRAEEVKMKELQAQVTEAMRIRAAAAKAARKEKKSA